MIILSVCLKTADHRRSAEFSATKSLTIMFLSTNNKCSLTNKSFYALNMKLSGDSLLICGDLRWSAVFNTVWTFCPCYMLILFVLPVTACVLK